MERERPTHRELIDLTAQTEAEMEPQRVPVNLYETPGAVVLLAPLPAVTSDDVTVELRDRSLRFWASLRSASPRDYLINEWAYGGYEREVEIPEGYGSGLEAVLTNGQLSIRVLAGDAVGTLTIQPTSHAERTA